MSTTTAKNKPIVGEGAIAPSPSMGTPRTILLEEWMWSEQGLALRPGCDLMVYAAIYTATSQGPGLRTATCADLSELLGYPKDTVRRSLARLTESCFIWSPAKVMMPRGGRPARCYACCKGTMDHAILGVAIAMAQKAATGATVSFQQVGTTMPETLGLPAAPSPNLDDPTSRSYGEPDAANLLNPLSQLHLVPADSPIPDAPLIGTYHPSDDEIDKLGDYQVEAAHAQQTETQTMATLQLVEPESVQLAPDPTTDEVSDNLATTPDTTMPAQLALPRTATSGPNETCPLSEEDRSAFDCLVERSMLPVDPGFMDSALKAFTRLVDSGIPSDVIVCAYDDYAHYWRMQRQETGNYRPMHLLNWLNLEDNRNIRYIMNGRDEHWRKQHREARTRAITRGRSKAKAKELPTHENPHFDRCIAGDRYLWFVNDERGGRRVEGSLGVASPTKAKQLYERMYERETQVMRERSHALGD